MTRYKLRITIHQQQAQITWQRTPLGEPLSAPPINFDYRFDAELKRQMTWYIEKYVGDPTGENGRKASAVRGKMRRWGRGLFELLFQNPKSPRSLLFFYEAIRHGLDHCDLAVSSGDPEVLNMPWELIYSPDYDYLAPQLNGMYRTLDRAEICLPLYSLSQSRFNILLVISRPRDEEDIISGVIARPLLDALRPLMNAGRVTLKVLQPPTFSEFEHELNKRKNFYHVVHFDGHGDPGKLVFEQNCDGGKDSVRAKEVGRCLRNCRVPIFLFNSCESAVIRNPVDTSYNVPSDRDPVASSVATQMMALGAKAVVAMSFAVCSKAARLFMIELYGELLRGKTIAVAVASGRRKLMSDPLRPGTCQSGECYLEDWMVPVLYQQEEYQPFNPVSMAKLPSPIAAEGVSESKLEKTVLVGVPDTGPFGFIGRHDEILTLERKFQQSNLVLIRGPKGVGKTELSCAWARWLVWTSGRERVFFVSFKQGRGLCPVLLQIGQSFMGACFRDLGFKKQQRSIFRYLRRHPCLLIWDNIDFIRSKSDYKKTLSAFLKTLRYSETWILLISRHEEKWVGRSYRQLQLRGLNKQDSCDFAKEVLGQAGVDPKQFSKDISKLSEALGGNPLCLQTELLKLKHTSAKQLTEDIEERLLKHRGVFYVS